jgi:hypothetical protein
VLTVECHCGGEAECRTLMFNQPEENGTVRIDVELTVGTSTYTCPKCGCEYFVDEIETHSDDEDDCTGDDDEDEDDDDEDEDDQDDDGLDAGPSREG